MKALAALVLIAALLGAAWHVTGHAWRELGRQHRRLAVTADDRLQHIRSSHAPRRYEFDTTQTYCMASDDPTDDCDTCYLLELVLSPAERAEVLAQQVRVLIAAKAQAWRDGYAAAGASDD